MGTSREIKEDHSHTRPSQRWRKKKRIQNENALKKVWDKGLAAPPGPLLGAEAGGSYDTLSTQG